MSFRVPFSAKPLGTSSPVSRRPVSQPVSRRTFLSAGLVGFTAVAFGVAGCGPKKSGGGSANGSRNPGVLKYPLTVEPTTLDPALVTDGPTIDMMQQMHEGLVGWNEKNEVIPLLAAEMPKISNGGKTYTFTIRPTAKFHNGRAVTADDVLYSLTRSLDKKVNSPVALNYLDDIVGAKEWALGTASGLAGVKVLDPKTIEINLTEPRAYFLGKLTYATGYVLPKEEVEKGAKTESGAYEVDEKNCVGCGPFKFGEYQRAIRVVMEANPDYWNGKPKLSRIERPIVLDVKTARNLYDSNELDYVTLEKGDYEQDKNNPALKNDIKKWDRAATYYLGLNQTNYAPFKDKRVRQAVAHAIDKAAIVKNVLLGVNEQAEGVVPKGIFSYDPTFRGLAYDPEQSKKLLADAGFPGGKGLPPLTLSFWGMQPDLRKTGEVVKEQLFAVGIPVSINEMEWGNFLKLNEAKKTDFFHMRWSADYIDPQNFLSLLLATNAPENYTGYSNPAYDKLCHTADAETDQAKRTALYREADKMVVDDAPWVPLYYQKDLELVKPYVSGIRDSLMGHLPHTTTEVA